MRLIDHAPRYGLDGTESLSLGYPEDGDGTPRIPLSFQCPCCKTTRIAIYLDASADGHGAWSANGAREGFEDLTLSHPIPLSTLDDGKHPDLRIVDGRFV